MMNINVKYGLFKYEVKDYYSILGVPIDASAKDIRLRYLKIAYQLHPDTCSAETPEEKEKASQILSKLVNPAYENLYKDKLRKECQLIFAEMSRRLASQVNDITISTEIAKTLHQAEKNRDKLYHELVQKIAVDQYQDINTVLTKIALISELNMVYLMSQNETQRRENISRSSRNVGEIQSSEAIITQQPSPETVANNTTQVQNETEATPQAEAGVNRLDRLIANAENAAKIGNLEQAILDMREALKLDNANPKVHGLISYYYYKQGNKTYGKIHYNKAFSLNPNEPIVRQIKEEFLEENKKTKGKSSKGKGKNKDDKKEGPTVFGIRLW
ncbi:DnaJ domain-containing protein [Cyanobacterium stanieri LEGE 03274]|uniref:DnaJ domain-containing protein n=1 Tax=Cyanobacterium stanieri LEGE 03274 TaxID=1828756 RepID=A0ABR9UZS2_9CHRO|nr:DnaJ domain-containing protein [Cyanobacterium stanieri]MBE9221141.1 DnaJ domain-containing protein [Cyanobacterium stanieri LEGE 03274]